MPGIYVILCKVGLIVCVCFFSFLCVSRPISNDVMHTDVNKKPLGYFFVRNQFPVNHYFDQSQSVINHRLNCNYLCVDYTICSSVVG